jgi:hypothetical protein
MLHWTNKLKIYIPKLSNHLHKNVKVEKRGHKFFNFFSIMYLQNSVGFIVFFISRLFAVCFRFREWLLHRLSRRRRVDWVFQMSEMVSPGMSHPKNRTNWSVQWLGNHFSFGIVRSSAFSLTKEVVCTN